MNIIITDNLRSHMVCHDKEFLKGWEKTFEEIQERGFFDHLKEDVELVEVHFEEPIGYGMLLHTTEDDEVVYAKRLERELYTRFVKGKEPTLIHQVMCILRKVSDAEDTYNLITMYPGGKSEKEPEDIHILDKEEMIRSLKFWKDRALIYREENIEKGSEKDYCPYKNLFYLLED